AELARLRRWKAPPPIDRELAMAALKRRALPGGKEIGRLVVKAVEDYGGQFALVLDPLSDVMVFEDRPRLLAYLEENIGKEETVRVLDRFERPLPCGYSDVILNLGLPNGFVSELRLVTRPIYELWDSHEAIAAEVDSIVAQARAGSRDLSTAEAARVLALLGELRALYAAAKGEGSETRSTRPA
ncbi:MAG TPA: hypothetical protein VFL04_02200, partial [Rectinemataceae bacterium]|nr:hypothetical protein [Rectinemataceae bacterium]